jgi:hypothetical protein
MQVYDWDFQTTRVRLATALLRQEPIDTGEWQSMNTTGSRIHQTRELMDVAVRVRVPASVPAWDLATHADLPWAEDHFLERVSGDPLNPPPSHVDWPHAVRGNEDHTDGGVFDHTYPERFWPKFAPAGQKRIGGITSATMPGIRFEYGDLSDVVSLLTKYPGTRQAYLPVWFPEDTGGHVRNQAAPGQGGMRVPCTLGYHFMIRHGLLTARYYLRSCDIRRHFHNDIYFAGRLMQWMCAQVHHNGGPKTMPGSLITYISSMHSFVADDSWLRGMMA